MFWTKHNWWYVCSRRDYHQVDEQDPYLPPSAASQAIAARTLRGQGSYPPTAPPLNSNALGTHNTIKQPLLLTPPPPSYATATARARHLHESMLKFVHEIFSVLFSFVLLATLNWKKKNKKRKRICQISLIKHRSLVCLLWMSL